MHLCTAAFGTAKCCGGRTPPKTLPIGMRNYGSHSASEMKQLTTLTELGWKVTVFWECELQNQESVERRLRQFLR